MEFSTAGVKVMLAMPTHRDIPPRTVSSLLQTQSALAGLNIPSLIEIPNGSSIVTHARNRAAADFRESDCTHIFWVDSDIEWDPKDFLRILAFGTVLECVGATYPCREEPLKFFVAGARDGSIVEHNKYGCIPIRGMGLGFTIVQRKVMEELAQRAPMRRYPFLKKGERIPRIFRCEDDGDDDKGEDVTFFDDIAALGYQIWLDPTIDLGHIGAKVYRGKFSNHLTEVEVKA